MIVASLYLSTNNPIFARATGLLGVLALPAISALTPLRGLLNRSVGSGCLCF